MLSIAALSMNCPSRHEDTLEHEDWNQNPAALAADLTTREDLNGIVNRRTNQDFSKEAEDTRTEAQGDGSLEQRRSADIDKLPPRKDLDGSTQNNLQTQISFFDKNPQQSFAHRRRAPRSSHSYESFPELRIANTRETAVSSNPSPSRTDVGSPGKAIISFQAIARIFRKFLGFIGPGFMVSVAYIDPGNYSTDVSAGVATKFKLLFIVLMSNIFAIILQSLAIRLGTVTGTNLAEHCRAHVPRWLNYALYLLGEGAIIATDIAEVGCVWPTIRE